jgi:hypothetical protein
MLAHLITIPHGGMENAEKKKKKKRGHNGGLDF